MLQVILKQSLKQHPTKKKPVRPLTTHLKMIQVSRTRHVWHSWRYKEEHISECSSMDPYPWTCQCRLNSKDLLTIIIILSCHHGYPWPSLSTPPNRSSLSAGPRGYTPYPHGAAVCRFELVALLLLGMCRGHRSISLMSSSLLLRPMSACLVRLIWIFFVIGGWWP